MDAPVWGTDLSMQNVLFHHLQLRMTAVFVCQTRMQKMFEIMPKHTLFEDIDESAISAEAGLLGQAEQPQDGEQGPHFH